uniref:Immunoglobulin V-set domain-containing protein n=1 Tax=Pundamilia nyererei TaxID=303518 RepID=A0A3B4FXP6_9CICH
QCSVLLCCHLPQCCISLLLNTKNLIVFRAHMCFKDIRYTQMYWYIQRPGETMRLIVYTVFRGNPDYGGAPENKYSAIKEAIENGALTVNNLQQNDSGVYFCAVSMHCGVRSRRSCTKTA